MTLSFRSLLIPICIAIAASAFPARAVVILDSTWKANGGSKGHETAGFSTQFALADERQFAGKVGLWDGEEYGGSGTWIGNDKDGHSYILTAAHNFGGGGDASTWTYYTSSGQELEGLQVSIHPKYDEKSEDTEGYDMAIVKLDDTIDDAGKAPCIYSGRSEKGKVGTMVGFGSRGIGSTGQQDKFYESEDPSAAAHNVIDNVEGIYEGNVLEVDFDKEDGSINTFEEGDAKPVDQYEGILGSGDSGGGFWIKAAGQWCIAGVNDYGDDSVYGSISGFARLSTQTSWISSVFSGAKFGGDD